MVRVSVFLLVFALLLPGPALSQETRFITDELSLDMRSGPGNQYRIQQMVPAGTQVAALEESQGWTRVRLAGGREGWVLTRMLTDTPSARARLEEIQQNAGALQNQNEELTVNLEQARQRVSMLEDALTEVSDERDVLSEQMERARQGLELHDENQEMRKQVIDLQREIQDLSHEIERLEERNDQRWFLVGGFVLFFGLLLGLILPRLGWRRRSSWGSGSL